MPPMFTACGINPAAFSIQLIDLGSRPGKKGYEVDPPWVGGHTTPMHEIWHVWDGVGDLREDHGEWQALEPGMLVWLKKGLFYETRQCPNNPSGISFFRFDMLQANGDPAPEDIAHEAPLFVDNASPNFCDMITRRILELHWEVYIDSQEGEGELLPEDVPNPRFWDDQNAFRRSPEGPIYTRMSSPARRSTLQLQLADSLLRSLVLEFLHLAERGREAQRAGVGKRHYRIINNLICNIRADIRNAPSVEEMARSSGYSLDHFCRIFRSYVRKTPQEFITTVRLIRAKELLIESDLSVKEIAERTGYGSAGFFSRQFRAKTLLTPKAFREKHRLEKSHC